MTDEERQEWLAMRKQLASYLSQTHDEIIIYPAHANDEDFRFLLRKAEYYQNMIDKLDALLNAPHD